MAGSDNDFTRSDVIARSTAGLHSVAPIRFFSACRLCNEVASPPSPQSFQEMIEASARGSISWSSMCCCTSVATSGELSSVVASSRSWVNNRVVHA